MGEASAVRVQTVVVGGGQAGLSVGYHLRRNGLPFLILEAHHRIGDSWRKRWDTLRLFTPAKFDGLDGMPFPAPPEAFPTNIRVKWDDLAALGVERVPRLAGAMGTPCSRADASCRSPT